MFLSRSDPPTLGESNLHGMCVSLNNPVVNIEDLPVSPARALIVLHDAESERKALTVAIRSLESGRVALFTFQGELRKARSATAVMDSALSFAESMGFLFDEDLIEFGGKGGRQRALRHWRELLGEPGAGVTPGVDSFSGVAPTAGPEPAPTPPPLGVQLPGLEIDDEVVVAPGDLAQELALDEMPEAIQDGCAAPPVASGPEAEPAPDVGVEVGSVPAVGAAPAPGAGSPATPDSHTPLPLTKFRRPEDAALGGAVAAATQAHAGSMKITSGPSALGRVPIVKRRVGDDGQAKSDFVMRLLRSF